MTLIDFKRTNEILPKLYEIVDMPECFTSKPMLLLYSSGFMTTGRYEKIFHEGDEHENWWDCVYEDTLGDAPMYWILLEEISWPEDVTQFDDGIKYGKELVDDP